MIAHARRGMAHETLGFGSDLQQYRIAFGVSQEKLAERPGLSRRSISDLERAARRTPSTTDERTAAASTTELTAAVANELCRSAGGRRRSAGNQLETPSAPFLIGDQRPTAHRETVYTPTLDHPLPAVRWEALSTGGEGKGRGVKRIDVNRMSNANEAASIPVIYDIYAEQLQVAASLGGEVRAVVRLPGWISTMACGSCHFGPRECSAASGAVNRAAQHRTNDAVWISSSKCFAQRPNPPS